jgi:hypothetical protein
MSKNIKIITFILIFFISFIFHIIDLNREGRTWDEQFKVDTGYSAVNNILQGNFSQQAWSQGIEHPIVAKYIYGLTSMPHIRIIKDINKISTDEREYLISGNYYLANMGNKLLVVDYDWTIPRLISAAFNSLTAALVFFVGFKLTNCLITSLTATLMLVTTPRFIAMGRLITYESISGLLAIITVLAFYHILNKKINSLKWYVIIGILASLMVWTRYNNIFIFVLVIGQWLLWNYSAKDKKNLAIKLLTIPLVTLIFGILIWPFLWSNFPQALIASITQHKTRVIITSLYHLKYFILTTPIIYLFIFLLGLVTSFRQHKFEYSFLIFWVLSVFIFFILFSSPTGGTRYIFVIYPAYGILLAIGFNSVTNFFKKRFNLNHSVSYIMLVIVALYGLLTAAQIHPYYLDYYNELVDLRGGPIKNSLDFSWWGEGQREAGLWLKNYAKPNSTLSLQVTPKYVFPRTRIDIEVFPYGEKIGQTDYMVISRFDLKSINSRILKKYKLIYKSETHGEGLVYVYQKI